jgi:AcrR family transcriptional regulator
VPLSEEQPGIAGDQLFNFPVEDPVTNLPETAQRILEAARRLLLRGGFNALKWDAIAAEAGRNKSAIKYYFGNTDGLISAIIDSLDYEDCVAMAQATRGTAGDERLDRYLAGKKRLASDGEGFLEFYDVLPHIIRDDRLRSRVADLYDWYYKMNIESLGLTDRVRSENREKYIAIAALAIAVVDGLALQAELRPRGFDIEKAFEVFEYFMKHSLEPFLLDADVATGPPTEVGPPVA